MREYYCKVNENPQVVKTYDTDRLLDECYKLVHEARVKLHNRDCPIHIVLPVDHLRALRYALAKDVSKQVSVTGSLNPYENRLFGAVLHDSILTDKVFVY